MGPRTPTAATAAATGAGSRDSVLETQALRDEAGRLKLQLLEVHAHENALQGELSAVRAQCHEQAAAMENANRELQAETSRLREHNATLMERILALKAASRQADAVHQEQLASQHALLHSSRGADSAVQPTRMSTTEATVFWPRSKHDDSHADDECLRQAELKWPGAPSPRALDAAANTVRSRPKVGAHNQRPTRQPAHQSQHQHQHDSDNQRGDCPPTDSYRSVKGIRSRLEAILLKHDPLRLVEVDELLASYRGAEDTLFESLELKYASRFATPP